MPTLPPRPLLAFSLCVLLLSLGGCAKISTTSPSPPFSLTRTDHGRDEVPPSVPSGENATGGDADAPLIAGEVSSCTGSQAVRRSEQNRASCFRLQPARTVLVKQTSGKKSTRSGKGVAKTATTSKSTKKSATVASKTGKTGKSATTAAPLVERTTGLCQPQSLIYARCRTGIDTCRLGDTSPVQWFACARKNGATTATPVAGSVMVIDTHTERRIYTGHPAYVEEAQRNADGTWKLRISHTNYDRKCHLDLDAQVLFDPRTMTATFQSGPWAPWAHRLRVLGFIVR